MITVLESINLSAQYLTQKGIESPRTNAELLLANILKCKRLDLYLLFDRPLGTDELKLYREYIKRRGNYEPLQYITGKVEFFGLEIKVNPSVLIPRPETELLVEAIIGSCSKEETIVILDIGCGSGNIAIALSVNLPLAKIVATDVNDEIIKVARENSQMHSVSSRIKFVKHNILINEINSFPIFDIVVSNPPYVSKESFNSLQREIKEYEPRYALTDESDGYTFFKSITSKISSRIKVNGKLFFEIAQGQSSEVKNILLKNNFDDIQIIRDYQNIDRIIVGEKK